MDTDALWKVFVAMVVSLLSSGQRAGCYASKVMPVPFHELASGRIAGGTEAKPGQFPFQVRLWIYTSDGKMSFCGGSILNANVVLTAAHCAKLGPKFRIGFGLVDVNAGNPKGQYRVTTTKLVHERAGTEGFLSNDIALLHFDEPVSFNEHIEPIRLPTGDDSYFDREVVMSGWGEVHTDSHMPHILRYVKSIVVSNLYCSIRYEYNHVYSTNICIDGFENKGICRGDSGGPLVLYEHDGQPTLIGVASFLSNQGCNSSYPRVFVRVTSYLDWIHKNVELLMRRAPSRR